MLTRMGALFVLPFFALAMILDSPIGQKGIHFAKAVQPIY
jgi:hypothetical protein